MSAGLARAWWRGAGAWARARRADLCALACVAAVFVANFGPTLLSGKSLLILDAYAYSYPLRTVAWEQIRSGVLPLWTPYVLSGYPMLSMAQLGLGYPLTWGYLFLPGHRAEEVYVLAPFLLIPAFTYAFARQLGRGPLASLLAGLAFGYGGLMHNGIGDNGLTPNAVMWLPLFLIAVERARTRPFARCLAGATAAYSMSLLTGYGQGFVYVALIALCYAAVVSASDARARRGLSRKGGPLESALRAASRWQSWRPLAVACGGILLAAGVAAFQLLETMRAVRRSVRGELSFEAFSAGSFPPRAAFASLLAPAYHPVEVTPYVAPLALLLAAFAAVGALRRGRDARVLFWLALAVLAWLLMLGPHTPLASLLHRLPFVSLFRMPARHAFEWTFAVAILSAYGFDSLSARLLRRHANAARPNDGDEARRGVTQDEWRNVSHDEERGVAGDERHAVADDEERGIAEDELHAVANDGGRGVADDGGRGVNKRRGAPGMKAATRGWIVAGACALVAAGLVGCAWWSRVGPPAEANAPLEGPPTEGVYLVWKAAFTALLLAGAWAGWRVGRARAGAWLLAASVVLACFVESFILLSVWWFAWAKPPARFGYLAPATRFVLAHTPAPERQRVYTRLRLFAEEFRESPRVDPPNLTALAGLHNVAGYEPLILDRYSRALGRVGPDAVHPRYAEAGGPDPTLFGARSHVLDLLNTTHVITYSNFDTAPAPTISRDGIRLSTRELDLTLAPAESAALAADTAGDTLVLVTSLANSVEEEHGRAVARLRVTANDGRTFELPLRAGLDTSEWAHERADVRPIIKHGLAPVFDGTPGDAADSFTSHRYLARIPLGGRFDAPRVEVTNVAARASVILWKASLFDSATGRSSPLVKAQAGLDAAKWQTAFSEDGVVVLRNLRALPRAWLVAEAEAVDGEEALRRIRGEAEQSGSAIEQVRDESASGIDSSATARAFDPRRTALLEVTPAELPMLPGGEVAAGSAARVVNYGANSLTVETDAPTATLLVVSEMFYPGWEATVDGQSRPILLTDYLLRGVAVPAGRHRVEMRYRAPAARNGAIISALSLCFVAGLGVYGWRGRPWRV